MCSLELVRGASSCGSGLISWSSKKEMMCSYSATAIFCNDSLIILTTLRMNELHLWPWIYEQKHVLGSVCDASRRKLNVWYSQGWTDQGRNKCVHVPQNEICRWLGQNDYNFGKRKSFIETKKVWQGAIICSLTDNYIANTLCAMSFLCGWGFGLGTGTVRFSSLPLTECQHQTNAYACMPVRPQCHKLSDIISVTPVWNELTVDFHMQTFIIRWRTSRNRSCVTLS